jgi:hypothetical protein
MNSLESLIALLEAELQQPVYEGCDYRSGLHKALAIVRQHATPDGSLIEKLEGLKFHPDCDNTSCDAFNTAIDRAIEVARAHPAPGSSPQSSFCIRCEQELFQNVSNDAGAPLKCPSVFRSEIPENGYTSSERGHETLVSYTRQPDLAPVSPKAKFSHGTKGPLSRPWPGEDEVYHTPADEQPDEVTCREEFNKWHLQQFGFVPFTEDSHPQSEVYYRGWVAAWYYPTHKRESRSQWQPIETAPKDGTKINAYGVSTDVGFGDDIRAGTCYWHDGRWLGGPFSSHCEPQWWQPFPTIPVSEIEVGAPDE